MKIINQNKEAANEILQTKQNKTERNKKSVRTRKISLLSSSVAGNGAVKSERERKRERVKCFENAPMCYM